MRDPGDATTATHFPTRTPQGVRRQPLAPRAPGPEAPVTRDRAGAQKGMIIVLAFCFAFWGALAALLIHLLH